MRSLVTLSLVALAGCDLLFELKSPGDAVPSDDAPTTCESMLDVDPANCGTCGHDCHGGTCAAGVCQPVALAENQQQPLNIALTAEHVYWVSAGDGTINRVRKDGGGGIEIMRGGQTGALDIAVDDSNFYWTTTDEVLRCPHTGCVGVPVVLGSCTGTTDLAVSTTFVFWTCSGGTQVLKANKATAGTAGVASGQQDLKQIVADGSDAYWAEKGTSTIRRAPVDGGMAPSPFVFPAPLVESLAVDADNVYWASFDVLTVMVASRPGGIVRLLADNQSNVEAITVVDGIVFYIGGRNAGYLRSCAAVGCDQMPTTIFAPIDVPVDIAADASDLFYSTAAGANNGTIMRLAR